jgi:hypothetical protein
MNEDGVVGRQGVLDLSHISSAEDLASITRIERVGLVVVRESLAARYARIPATRVGATVYVPDDVNVRVHAGSLVVSGDGLGGPDDVLVVVGVLVITSPVTGAVPRRVNVVGSVLAPRGSEAMLGPILGSGSGDVAYYRYVEGQDISVSTGQVRLSGALLANSSVRPDDVLIAAGQVVVSGPVPAVGYGQVLVLGQFVAPEESRSVLEPVLRVHGQSGWYRGADPRIVLSDMEVGPDFFRLLDEPVSLVVLGDLTVGADVTMDEVRAKIASLVVFGDVTAPAGVVAVFQVLATDVYGDIRADDGPRH